MAKVLRKPQAEADLIEIWTYIAQDSLIRADKLLDEIDEKSQMLAQSPFIGKARDELAPTIRSFPIGNYLLFYQPIEDGIEIIRVLHRARDIEALFNP
ncbi:MAG: type II toxin-antitoxin system RelE/ParE family toxin [Desulfobacterales bacterium]